MGKILTADEKAHDLGFRDYRDWLQRGFTLFPLMFQGSAAKWNGQVCGGPAVEAYVNGGRWLAKCDFCGNIEDVTYRDPFFWCHRCGCPNCAGAARPVIFPENREEIEELLLARPVQPGFGFSENDRAAGAIPLAGLRRDWVTGQDLKSENDEAGL